MAVSIRISKVCILLLSLVGLSWSLRLVTLQNNKYRQRAAEYIVNTVQRAAPVSTWSLNTPINAQEKSQNKFKRLLSPSGPLRSFMRRIIYVLGNFYQTRMKGTLTSLWTCIQNFYLSRIELERKLQTKASPSFSFGRSDSASSSTDEPAYQEVEIVSEQTKTTKTAFTEQPLKKVKEIKTELTEQPDDLAQGTSPELNPIMTDEELELGRKYAISKLQELDAITQPHTFEPMVQPARAPTVIENSTTADFFVASLAATAALFILSNPEAHLIESALAIGTCAAVAGNTNTTATSKDAS